MKKKLRSLVNPRVLLEKGKTAREFLEEQGLWEEYRLDERFAMGNQ